MLLKRKDNPVLKVSPDHQRVTGHQLSSKNEKARTFVRALLPLTPERLYYTS